MRALEDRIRRDRDVVAREHRPFLVLTPLGQPASHVLDEALSTLGAAVVERARVRAWSHAASALYVRPGPGGAYDIRRLRIALAYEQEWETFAERTAEAWFLDSDASHRSIFAEKLAVRTRMPVRRVPRPDLDTTLDLHAFHVPDEEQVAFELAILRRFIA